MKRKTVVKRIGQIKVSTQAEFAIIEFQGKMVFANNSNKLPLHSLIDAFSISAFMNQRNGSGLGHTPTQDTRARSRITLQFSRNPNF